MIIDITRDYNKEEYNIWRNVVAKYRITELHSIDYDRFPDAPYWGDGPNVSKNPDDYEDGDYYAWIDNLLSKDEKEKIKEYLEKIADIEKHLYESGWKLHSTIRRIEQSNLLYIDKLNISYIILIDDCSHSGQKYFKIFFKENSIETKIFDAYLRNEYLSDFNSLDLIKDVLSKGWTAIKYLETYQELENFKEITKQPFSKLTLNTWLNDNCNDFWFNCGSMLYFKDKKDALMYKMRLKGTV